MEKFSGGLFLAAILWSAGSLAVAAAPPQRDKTEQESSDPKKTTRITLASTSGTPGKSVVIPIYFTHAEEMQVGRLTLEVNFVSRNLKFSHLESGPAADLGGVDLHSEVKESKDEQELEITALTIVASFLTIPPPQKGIPAGLLAYLNFRLNENARPANISVRASGEAAELATNKPIQNLRIFDAQVDVLAPGSEPMLACFFFTH